MMFLTNTQHRQNRRAVSVWSKEAMGNLPYSCRLCYTWQFLIQLAMLFLANAVIDMDRCYFKCIGCKVLSVVHILL